MTRNARMSRLGGTIALVALAFVVFCVIGAPGPTHAAQLPMTTHATHLTYPTKIAGVPSATDYWSTPSLLTLTTGPNEYLVITDIGGSPLRMVRLEVNTQVVAEITFGYEPVVYVVVPPNSVLVATWFDETSQGTLTPSSVHLGARGWWYRPSGDLAYFDSVPRPDQIIAIASGQQYTVPAGKAFVPVSWYAMGGATSINKYCQQYSTTNCPSQCTLCCINVVTTVHWSAPSALPEVHDASGVLLEPWEYLTTDWQSVYVARDFNPMGGRNSPLPSGYQITVNGTVGWSNDGVDACNIPVPGYLTASCPAVLFGYLVD